jgi:hypothetical protein
MFKTFHEVYVWSDVWRERSNEKCLISQEPLCRVNTVLTYLEPKVPSYKPQVVSAII